nr:MAG TPA: hypothetical protein [Caudoviricetes sp.]
MKIKGPKWAFDWGVMQRPPAGERPAAGGKGGGIAYPLFPCEVLPEVQRQAAS